MRETQGLVGQQDGRPSSLLKISNEMVRLHKELFGRGPTKARSDWAGPDVLICTLRETFTPAEKSMVRLGEHQRLRDTRLFFQYATEDQFIGAVEPLVGRKVTGFVSGLDTRRDIATEVFYFDEPDETA